MYIIEDGKAYLVDGEVGYLANFDTAGKMVIDKEETIDVLNKVVYTYDEMYAKLNIAYNIQEAIKESAMSEIENEIIAELKNKVAELEKENLELKKQLEASKSVEKEPEIKEPTTKIETKEENAKTTNKKEK